MLEDNLIDVADPFQFYQGRIYIFGGEPQTIEISHVDDYTNFNPVEKIMRAQDTAAASANTTTNPIKKTRAKAVLPTHVECDGTECRCCSQEVGVVGRQCRYPRQSTVVND